MVLALEVLSLTVWGARLALGLCDKVAEDTGKGQDLFGEICLVRVYENLQYFLCLAQCCGLLQPRFLVAVEEKMALLLQLSNQSQSNPAQTPYDLAKAPETLAALHEKHSLGRTLLIAES